MTLNRLGAIILLLIAFVAFFVLTGNIMPDRYSYLCALIGLIAFMLGILAVFLAFTEDLSIVKLISHIDVESVPSSGKHTETVEVEISFHSGMPKKMKPLAQRGSAAAYKAQRRWRYGRQ